MSDRIYNPNTIPTFHHGHEKPMRKDPQYDVPWATPVPPLKSQGNVTYSQMMDVIEQIWEKAHPEVKFVPYGSRDNFDPEIGYIVYSLEMKKPAENNLKPKFREDMVQTDAGPVDGAVFTQSFNHLVQFTAVHVNPKIAEELIETFEDFFTIITKELIQVGVENVYYNRRNSDRDETRFGQDVATRNVQFLITLQKLLLVNTSALESIRIDVRLLFEKSTPDTYSIFYMDVPYETED